MSEKIIEHLSRRLEEIKALDKEGVIKDSCILDFSKVNIEILKCFAVCMTLRTKYTYTYALLENWRERLGAGDYVFCVDRNRLKIRFYVLCSKDTQEP